MLRKATDTLPWVVGLAVPIYFLLVLVSNVLALAFATAVLAYGYVLAGFWMTTHGVMAAEEEEREARGEAANRRRP